MRTEPLSGLWTRVIVGLSVVGVCWSGALAADVPAVEGWKATGEVQAFPSGELWKHINGAAELFESHGVRELTVRNLQRSGTSVEVSVYEMSSALGAFGVYGVESSSGGTPIDVGSAAMLFAPYQALMQTGRFYVKVDVREGELNDESARSLLAGVAGGLPAGEGLPDELGRLPTKGRIEGSLAYTAQGFLGLSELRRCVHADYGLDGGSEATLFLMLPAEGERVEDLWSALPKAWSVAGADRAFKQREIPYRGAVVITAIDGGLLGATGLESGDDLIGWLTTVAP
jgi:hypothetical protein